MIPKYSIVACILTFTASCFAQTDGIVERFELKKISVKGNKLFSDKEIGNMLGLEKGTIYERYLFDFYLDDGLDTVERRYSLEGYEDAKVRWAFKDVKENNRKMQVEIEEGERKKIADVVIRGAENGDLSEINDKLTVKPGEPLAEGLVAKGADDIASYYLNRGFADVNVKYEIRREDATVIYDVDEGRRFRIDKVVISGNLRTRGKIIQREVKLKRGDLYNQELVDESRKNIYDTKLYRQVRIEPHPSDEFDDMKTLSVLVEEDKPRWVEINPGYSSPDRVRIAGKWGHNNFLFNNNNRLTFEGDISYGFLDKRFRGESSLTYVEPWLFGYRYRGELELSTERSIYSDFHYWQVTLEPKVSKELGKFLELGGGFEYSIVDFTYGPEFLKEFGGKLAEGTAAEEIADDSKEKIAALLNISDYDIFIGKLYQKYDSTND
ncbi:MAG: hypothetical protein GY771_12885, partial [bacterium]|nr:hypothetical protein [bacterium]